MQTAHLDAVRPDMIDRVAGWLSQPENYRWLDFGNGPKPLHPASLKIMLQRDIHRIQAVFAPDSDRPIGVVALSNINRDSRSASLWYVLGDKTYEGRGYLGQAVAEMLRIGFEEIGLNSVTAWCAASNGPSRRILEKNGFQPMGRQRECHPLDDMLDDRLLYDLLAHDYQAFAKRNERLARHAVA